MSYLKEEIQTNFLENAFLFSEYVSATENLIEKAKERGGRDIPNAIYPIGYLFRHSLELGVKTIISLHGNVWPRGHLLSVLKDTFKKLFSIEKEEDEIIWTFTPEQITVVTQTFEEIKKEFPEVDNQKFEALRNFNLQAFLHLLEKYHNYDPTGEIFRYPESRLSYDKKVQIFESISEDIEVINTLKAFLGLFASTSLKLNGGARDPIEPESEKK